MSATQKVILIALVALGAIAIIVGMTLSHYIGGFMRTIEEEARDAQEREERKTTSEQE